VSDKPPHLLLDAVLIVIAGASTISVLALTCRRWRATKAFLGLAALFWVVAAWIFASHTISTVAPRALSEWWRDFLVNFAILAPIAILPTAVLVECVAGSHSRRSIPIVAVVAWALAFPISVFLAIVLSCKIWHECM
jgi:hypothetical protein